MTELLPIADGPELRRHARRIAGRHRGALAGVVVLHALAAAAGLVAPALLGVLVQAVSDGTTESYVDTSCSSSPALSSSRRPSPGSRDGGRSSSRS